MENAMLTLYDYLPSQNGWKVRQLLQHLRLPYRSKVVSIFEGEGRDEDYLAINPTGAVPAILFDDGQTLAESNAILFYLARGSIFLSDDPFAQAKTLQWLSFEADYIQSTLGAVRHWRMTGKLDRRPPELVRARQLAGNAALAALERELATRDFLVGSYGIADISMYAYAHLAEEADVSLLPFPNVTKWIERVQTHASHLAERHPYSIDPHSGRELP
jgi:glutathione S-transferase